MRFSAHSLVRTLLVAGAALVSLAARPSYAQPDPPAQAGRISYITGNVSFQPVGSQDWGEAEPNYPIGPGDRIFTDSDGRAEIQVGQTFLRIGPNSDVSMVDSTSDGLYFGVAQGSVHLSIRGLWQGQAVYVNTPNGSSTTFSTGEVRVDVMPDQDASIFSTFDGNANEMINGAGGFQQPLYVGQALELFGSNPVYPQWLDSAHWDNLDQWGRTRDQQIAASRSYRYVSPEIPGAYEMDAYGDWQPNTPYGAVWFPRNVDAGWAPYHNGHWVNHAPWGWVWVEDEPWGYAPFHYGRWVSFEGRWGWIPGPPAAHPVWSPALVVFAGGVNFGGSVVSAWFPLGPGEAYHPTYPCSPAYVESVNRTNITVTNVVHVQTTYVNVTNVTYVNRTIGVTAMRHEDFAAGRPARQAAVKVDVHQLERVQPLAAPVVKPTAQSFIGHAPARPVPVAAARPVLINAKGMAVAATPNARPAPPPVKAAPIVRAPAGHTVIAPPANAVKAPAAGAPAKPGMPPPPPPAKAAATPGKPQMMAPAAAKAPVEPPAKPGTPAMPVGKTPPPPPPAKPGATEAARPLVKPAPVPPIKAAPVPPVKVSPANEARKPALESVPPAKEIKPGTLPPVKTDKEKKEEKDKRDKEKKGDKDKE